MLRRTSRQDCTGVVVVRLPAVVVDAVGLRDEAGLAGEIGLRGETVPATEPGLSGETGLTGFDAVLAGFETGLAGFDAVATGDVARAGLSGDTVPTADPGLTGDTGSGEPGDVASTGPRLLDGMTSFRTGR